MAHSVPQMNLFEYKHKSLKLKTKFIRTKTQETQTSFNNTPMNRVPKDINYTPQSSDQAINIDASKQGGKQGTNKTEFSIVDIFGLSSLSIVCGECLKLRAPTDHNCKNCF